MAKVTLKNVVKSYGDVKVIHSINLDIKDGEFIVIVGPSGCGKSTTLRMIAGLESISEGTIEIGNTIVNEIPSKYRNISMVFQDYALYPHMTVYQNMAFSLRLENLSKFQIAEKVLNAADTLEITGLLKRIPRELDDGQRQSVAIGRALVRNPEVLLFDEPFSNFDAKLGVKMRLELKKLHQKLKTTTVYVTHDQVEAMTLADRIVIMKDGIIQQVGNPVDVYEKPANSFVRGFIGQPVMNMNKTKRSRPSDTYQVDAGETTLSNYQIGQTAA
jgi:multiple sugar transport system ATP-binding protein